ncbi:glycerol dehydratase reactivase beta/small subunit family protein [Desemzia sp. C1]|uniref:glycerol dehydratase reactivase beta/small subunit family protein n=1 Tax=Desemzia sp. C1 TaxID=2892016 RepID=UPI001E29120C|nr:glycerol dehydratase reactivase beta/small subunit family protein [Desemzia sp. C1]MCI3029299.1 glycerol dehydratase reactivase beta/small subunit family protein [Desemzia sp. C1]
MTVNESNRPTIVINIHNTIDEKRLKDVLFGIEEEGIPYLIKKNDNSNAISSAYEASKESRLSVGIGCNQSEVVVHYKNLEMKKYLFKVSDYQSKPKELMRTLGSNAARLVKGDIFKENNGLEVSF